MGAYLFVVGSQELAGPLVQGNQTWRRGQWMLLVIDAISRSHEQNVSVNEHGTRSSIMGKNGQAGHIEPPNDVGVLWSRLYGRMPNRDLVVPFIEKRPVISVGHAVRIQAEDFVSIGHYVNAVAIDGRRRAYPQFHRVEVGAFPARGQARNHKPPKEPPRRLVQAKEGAAARRLEAWIREATVVGANEDLATDDRRAGIRLAA